MAEPTPERGVLRWAYYHAVRDRAKFWVGSVGLAAVVVVVSTQVSLPAHATTTQKIVNGLVVLAIATIGVVVATYLYALLLAPYQQRNALRGMLAEAAARVDALATTPVSPQHADQLRQVAERVRRSILTGELPAYRTPGRDDQEIWRSAFFEHFPELCPSLEIVEDRDREARLLRDRLKQAAHAAGMDRPPWQFDEFIMAVADVINRRAIQGILEGLFNFNWVQEGGLVGLDDPVYGPTILSLADPTEDTTKYKETFEEFFREAERWPEAKNFRSTSLARNRAGQKLQEELDIIVNTETFTTRCRLCRQ